jgi:adenine/guanine phosphoribosyltransferase-like PRPP-binding protein
MIQFTSIGPFLELVYSQLARGTLAPNNELEIDTSKPNTLLDLFALGRLLAFLHELALPPYSIKPVFRFPSPARSRKTQTHLHNLKELDFFKYCDSNGIDCRFDPKAQLYLPSIRDEEVEEQRRLVEGKKYWKCIIPLSKHTFPKPEPGDERQVLKEVNKLVKSFSTDIQKRMTGVDLSAEATGLEVSRMLFSIIRELLSNVITHSTQSEFLFAMTLSRDTWTGYRPHRPGVTPLSGQDKYEILVMDFGQGISPSVINILDERKNLALTDDYFSLTKWVDRYQTTRAKEESLLTNIFRGDLVIRKGRKSEGLYELGQSLSWFGGVLSLFTGRTELVISSAESEELTPELRRLKDRYLRHPYYLPGVIASPILPSQQLKTAFIKSTAERYRSSLVSHRQPNGVHPCVIRRLNPLPSGLFGGMSDIKIRRRSELVAEFIASEYQKARAEERDAFEANLINNKEETQFCPFFWDVNLKLSDNIDVSFLDSLIQELCKRLDQFETGDSRNFFKLIFTNVPRNIIHALQKRNCRSFLMLKGTFCLLLDEADEPHFLGVPRVTNNIVDLQDALGLIFELGSTSSEPIAAQEYLGVDESLLKELTALIGTNDDSIFFTHSVGNVLRFECYDVRAALNDTRRGRLEALKAFLISQKQAGQAEAVFQLRNGTYVDSLYDFCLFWSDEEKLVDCAKLLLEQSGFPLVDTIVAFMNNGDRLAAAIQRFTKAPNLIIADPHRPSSWENLEIDGEFVLVLDALYPGDDDAGYIVNFIKELRAKNDLAKVHKILVFLDFRDFDRTKTQDIKNWSSESLQSERVISVPPSEQLSFPRRVVPNGKVNIIQNFQSHTFSKFAVTSAPPDQEEEEELLGHSQRYSPIELSTEFWQNISALGVIESKRTGREDRNVLFYENNERLIQNSRLRRIVTEFTADYVKNILKLRVDVVLHPTHPVGSFLAQLVSKQLNSTPVVIPLTQRKYGGAIELSSADYESYNELIASLRTRRRGEELTCLIVDDSVLTGSSLFTMMGVAAALNLRTKGVLVLLSRLSPEISRTLSLLPVNFAFLYQLHMPILNREESPDIKLSDLNEQVVHGSSSYFAQWWTTFLRTELHRNGEDGSHFRPAGEIIAQNPPSVAAAYVANLEGEHLDTHVLRQVIKTLLLHSDPLVLNFYTRVAIAYNFLGQLVYEGSFWNLLTGLFESNANEPRASSQSIMLLRKVLYILAFSKHISRFAVYTRFQELCVEFIKRCLDDESWVELKDLVTDCTMWLGVIGSEQLAEVGKPLLLKTAKYALRTVADEDTQENLYQPELENMETLRRKAAMDITGALAWSISTYISKKGMVLLDNKSAEDLVNVVVRDDLSTEGNLILIDIFEPVISASRDLRDTLGIEMWATEERFLSELTLVPENHMLDYLEDAPGYTCTLKTLLKICKADTVLLYAKNRSDKEFFLRVFETRQNKMADDDLKSDYLRQKHLSKHLRERMDQYLFFSSTRLSDARALNDFSVQSSHLWCMGGPVKISSEMSYYVILGYAHRKPARDLQNTAYYYWLKCESLLREILPRIHSKYVESATAWNAHIQSIRPFHPIKVDDERRTDVVNVRREIVSQAMTKIDIGDLLRRAVRMSSEPVYRLDAIRDQLVKVCKDLRIFIKSTLEEKRNIGLFKKSLFNSTEIPIGGPSMEALTSQQRSAFCSLPIAVLEFIVFESLFNSIAYHDREIDVDLEFDPPDVSFVDIPSTVDVTGIRISVSNDIHPKAVSEDKPLKPIGLTACKTAASAVYGDFNSQYNENRDRWVATLILPAYRVPEGLGRHLRELLV